MSYTPKASNHPTGNTETRHLKQLEQISSLYLLLLLPPSPPAKQLSPGPHGSFTYKTTGAVSPFLNIFYIYRW